jgi:hypothetical protein
MRRIGAKRKKTMTRKLLLLSGPYSASKLVSQMMARPFHLKMKIRIQNL